MPEVAIVYHEDFLKHVTGWWHPESPERLEAIMKTLSEEGLLEKLRQITPEAASEETLALVHERNYIRWVANQCRQGARWLDWGDTVVCEDSFRVALLAAGAATSAADWVMEKKCNAALRAAVSGASRPRCGQDARRTASETLAVRGRRAFCAVRPPGHHAGADRAMGFCLFNNLAICARYLQNNHGVGRVLIVDWDVHHGNGTQSIFYADPSVFYFSVHQYPYYPGTGAESEKGAGEGEGYTLNVPLPAGGGDEEYIGAFCEKLVPAADRFEPDIVLISAGFDSHMGDPLGAMCITDDGFAELTECVKGIAEKHSEGRIISLLEGGYDLKAMPASIVRHLKGLMV